MLGSATLTIVMSSSSISMPRHTVISVHHLRAMAHLQLVHGIRASRSVVGARLAPAK